MKTHKRSATKRLSSECKRTARRRYKRCFARKRGRFTRTLAQNFNGDVVFCNKQLRFLVLDGEEVRSRAAYG